MIVRASMREQYVDSNKVVKLALTSHSHLLSCGLIFSCVSRDLLEVRLLGCRVLRLSLR